MAAKHLFQKHADFKLEMKQVKNKTIQRRNEKEMKQLRGGTIQR